MKEINTEVISKIVEDGLNQIYKDILDAHGYESGDCPPEVQIPLDKVEREFTSLLQEWMVWRKEF